MVKGLFRAWWEDKSETGEQFEICLIGKIASDNPDDGMDYIAVWYDGRVGNIDSNNLIELTEGNDSDLRVYNPYELYPNNENEEVVF